MIPTSILSAAEQIDTEFTERVDDYVVKYMKGESNKHELINRLSILIEQHDEKRRNIREDVRKITDNILFGAKQ